MAADSFFTINNIFSIIYTRESDVVEQHRQCFFYLKIICENIRHVFEFDIQDLPFRLPTVIGAFYYYQWLFTALCA